MKIHQKVYLQLYNLKRFFVTIAFILSFTVATFATSYTVSTDINASTLSSRTEDTLYIDAVVTLNTNETWNFTAVLMRAPYGTIFWANNSNLSLPGCTVFNIQTGPPAAPGLLPTGGNASKVLVIGGVKVAVSNDNANNAAFSFEEFTDLGGLPKFTVTSNSPVCTANALSIIATSDRSSTIAYNYNWTISPVSGAFSPVSSTSTTSGATTISPSPGNYTITCKIYATGDPLATVTANVVVSSLPTITPAGAAANVCLSSSVQTTTLAYSATTNTPTIYGITWSGSPANSFATVTDASLTTSPLAISVPANTVAGTYTGTITVKNSVGCASSTGTNFTVTVNPLPTATISGTTAVCQGSPSPNITFTGGAGTAPYTFTYKINSSSNQTVTTTLGNSVTVAAPTTLAGTFVYTLVSVRDASSTNCSQTQSGTATITVNALPTATISGTTAVCMGSASPDITFTGAAGTTPYTFTYKINNGSNQTVTTTSGNSVTVAAPTTSAGSFVYTLVDVQDAGSTTCSQTQSGTASVTVNPRPTGVLSGTTIICKGSSATLSLAVTSSGTISGMLSDGTPFTGTAPTISISVSPTLTTIYSIATLSNNTCSSIAADTLGTPIITVNDPAEITDQPLSAIFCAGSDASFTVTAPGAISYQWQVSTDGGTIYNNIANSAIYSGVTTNTLTISNTPATMGGYLYQAVITSISPCPVITSNPASLFLKNSWTGNTNDRWYVATNWIGNILPDANCPDIYIPQVASDNYPVLTSETVSVTNLIIKANASVTVGTNATLQVAGGITKQADGKLHALGGAIEFNGTGAQTISGSLFHKRTIHDFKISNPYGVNVSSALHDTLNITGTLSFGSVSNTTLNTGNNITLRSGASGTANVGQINNGNNITGEVIVERYIPAKRAWRFLSVPSNTIQTFHQAWQENQPQGVVGITGYGTQVTHNIPAWADNGFDYNSPDGPSVKIWNSASNSYTGLSNTNIIMGTAEGFMTFVRGDRTAIGLGATPTVTILRTKGTLKIGDQATISAPSGKIIGVANPYASAIDMRNISKTAGKNYTFYLYNPNINSLGAFQTFLLSANGNYYMAPASSTTHNYIESGQAFFIASDGGSITIKENSKAAESGPMVFRSSKAEPLLQTNLYVLDPNGNSDLVDGVLNTFGDNYRNAVDEKDVKKMMNFSENLGIKTDDQILAVETRHSITKKDTIFLNMSNMKMKSYQFEITGKNFNHQGLTGFLEDNYLNTATPLNITGTTTINFKVVEMPGSWNPNRFRIVFKKEAAFQVATTVANGSKAAIKIYPNPVVDRKINVQLINQPKGNYNIRLINTLGEIMLTKQLYHKEEASTEFIEVNKNIANGSYQLEVTGPDKNTLNKNVILD